MTDHAWIFDLDGTLLDSVDLHAESFVAAFAERGLDVAKADVLDRIGMGGDRLVAELAGDGLTEEASRALRQRQGERVRARAQREGVGVLPGTRELLDAVRRRGMRTAVASASKLEDLDALLEAAGLPLRELVDELVSGSDVERTKPAPDAVDAALSSLGLPPERCLFVGDTVWDVLSASRAGVPAVGVATGPHDARRLREAGARRVHPDLRALAADVDGVLEACFGAQAPGGPAR